MLWSFEKCTSLTPQSKNLALLKPMSINCLTRCLPLIGISTIWLLNKFGVFVNENHGKFPIIYWLPKLHKGQVLLQILNSFFFVFHIHDSGITFSF